MLQIINWITNKRRIDDKPWKWGLVHLLKLVITHNGQAYKNGEIWMMVRLYG